MMLSRVKNYISRKIDSGVRRFSQPIAFMHIPKTAGTSISEGLRLSIKPANPLRERLDRSLFGSFTNFETFNPATAADIFLGLKPMPKNTDFISGHFGLSSILNNFPRAKVVTFLREPSTRILSHWLYWRSIPEVAVKSYGDMGDNIRAARYPLIDFMSRPSTYCQLDNLHTRMLLWSHSLIPQNGLISEEHDDILLKEALAKLSTLSHVDVVENPQLEKNLSKWIGGSFNLPVLNVTTSSTEHEKVSLYNELTPDAWVKINHFSRLDLKLWQALVAKKMPGVNVQDLRLRVIEKTIKRYELM